MAQTTIDIPGGTATLRDPKDITVAGRRAVQLTVGRLDPEALQLVIDAAKAKDPTAFIGLPFEVQEQILGLPDATVYALLVAWTIDHPLPKSVADVGAMPAPVYDALLERIQEDQGEVLDDVDRFSIAAVEDSDSPTGASAASNGRSTAVAARRRAPSDRLKPSGSKSSSTGKRSA